MKPSLAALVWDDACEADLAKIKTELERARYVEPVSPAAAVRLREDIGRLERIAERLGRRKREAQA